MPPATKVGNSLGRLIQFLIELAQDGAFAKVTLTIQAGRIEFVHVDRSYKLGDLPVRDPQRPGIG